MKKWLALMLVSCGTAAAVEPAYEGWFGNPEEPALRPFKWVLSGAGALFYQTGKGFRDGNMNTPVSGSVKALRGAGIGAIELGNSTWNGLVYKPLTDRREYRKTHSWNAAIEQDMLLRNVRDMGSTGLVYYPSLKRLDCWPKESNEKVAIRLDRARETREAQAAARKARDPYAGLSRRERAQMRHVPERAAHGIAKKQETTGNLLKLAR